MTHDYIIGGEFIVLIQWLSRLLLFVAGSSAVLGKLGRREENNHQ